LSKLEGEAKARQQAAYDAEDAGVTDELAIKGFRIIMLQQRKHSGKKGSEEGR
jgi:hypothetical protein